MNGHHEARDLEKWKEYERLCHKYPAATTNSSRQGISSWDPFPQMQIHHLLCGASAVTQQALRKEAIAGVSGVQSVGVLGQQQIHKPEQSWSNMKTPRHQNQPQLTHQSQGQQNHRSSLHLEPWQYGTSVGGGGHLPNNAFQNIPHNPTALGLEAVDVNFQQKASMQVMFGLSLGAPTTMEAPSSSRFPPHQMLNPGLMGSEYVFDAGHGNNTSSAVTSHSRVNCANPQSFQQVMHSSSPRAITYPPNPGVVSSLRSIPVQIAQDAPPFPQPAFDCTTSNLIPPTSLRHLVTRVPSGDIPVQVPQQPLEDERDTSLQGIQTTFSSEQSMGVEIIPNLPEPASNSDKFDDSFNWFECYGLEGQGGLEETIHEKPWFRTPK
ncbi:uncharacterized protein [Physcomitrium patens]